VTTVYEVMELEDAQRNSLLQMNSRQMRDVAKFCNAYPSIEVTHSVEDADELNSSRPVVVQVDIERDADEDDSEADYTVVAPLYPSAKAEGWWVVVSEPATNTLLSVKKIALRQRQTVKLDFTLAAGAHDLSLTVVCDSYVGADREFEFKVQIGEGEESEDDSDEDEEMSVEG